MDSKERFDRCVFLAQQVALDPGLIGVMSTGECIIAAFLHNRMDWLPGDFSHPLDAVDRLDVEWRVALRAVHSVGWR